MDTNCLVREEVCRFLRANGLESRWTHQDGYGEYISLESLQSWDESRRNDFFAELNDYSVSKFGARKICHPKSNLKSKLPKNNGLR
jgi:hypothetical protein